MVVPGGFDINEFILIVSHSSSKSQAKYSRHIPVSYSLSLGSSAWWVRPEIAGSRSVSSVNPWSEYSSTVCRQRLGLALTEH